MQTYFLKFPDEETFNTLAMNSGAWYVNEDNNGSPIMASHTHAFDIIGIMYEPGLYDEDTGVTIYPPAPLDGYHVNAKFVSLPEEWEQYVITPNSPIRIFAGD